MWGGRVDGLGAVVGEARLSQPTCFAGDGVSLTDERRHS